MPLEAQIAALNHASWAISTSNSALHTLLLARPRRRVLGLHLHHLGVHQALIDILCGARADHRRIGEQLIEEQVAGAADRRRRLDTAPGFLRSFRLPDPVALGTVILRLVERSPTARVNLRLHSRQPAPRCRTGGSIPRTVQLRATMSGGDERFPSFSFTVL
jgi:hypothetical protein